ncbi:hypothetical protein ACFVXW_10325 [Streptomyces sp. NPDC058251]|uniref:hypothetical protein n=1 Tax=Streptomyces sp. NPDC058251 TaxID=3346404 RepID=UPI0036EB817C
MAVRYRPGRSDRATDAEAVALFMACHNARDRFIVLLGPHRRGPVRSPSHSSRPPH